MRNAPAWAVVAVVLAGCGDRTGLELLPAPGSVGVDASTEVGGADATADTADAAPSDARPDDGCPVTPPSSGAACPIVGQLCVYQSSFAGPCSDTAVGGTSVWSCGVDGWSNSASCIDQSRCPDTMPNDGDACGLNVDGADCFYSTAGCQTGGVAQCSNGRFVGTNDCGARALSGCELVASASQALSLTGGLTDPALSLIGVQALVGAHVDDGSTDGLALELDVLQVAGPLARASIPATTRSLASQQSAPIAVTSMRDEWWALDPVNSGGAPSIQLDLLGSNATSAGGSTTPLAGAPSAIAIAPSGGWAAARSDTTTPGAQKATLLPIDATGQPVGTGDVVADESKAPAPGVPPVEQALATVARATKGFVVAYTVPASGDLRDDSGVEVVFIDDPTARLLPPQEGNAFRVDAGAVGQIAIAPMRDGSVVLATTPYPGKPLATSIALTRVSRDGTIATLTPQTVGANDGIGSGVALAALDDGFVLAFQIRGFDPSTGLPTSSVNVIPYAADGTPTADSLSIGRGVTVDSPIALATAPLDRTIHFAFVDADGAPDQLHYGRVYCKR